MVAEVQQDATEPRVLVAPLALQTDRAVGAMEVLEMAMALVVMMVTLKQDPMVDKVVPGESDQMEEGVTEMVLGSAEFGFQPMAVEAEQVVRVAEEAVGVPVVVKTVES